MTTISSPSGELTDEQKMDLKMFVIEESMEINACDASPTQKKKMFADLYNGVRDIKLYLEDQNRNQETGENNGEEESKQESIG